MPAVAIVDSVLGRDRDTLEQIASALQWPTQYDRVVAVADGIYRGRAGVPTWSGYKQSERLDISLPPWWLRAGQAAVPARMSSTVGPVEPSTTNG